MDPSGEQTSKQVKKLANDVCLTLKFIEEATQWANLAERYVEIFKNGVKMDRGGRCSHSVVGLCRRMKGLNSQRNFKELASNGR